MTNPLASPNKTPPTTASNRMLYAYFLGFLAVLAFGATLPVTVIALDDFTPGFITFFRAAIAALLAILSLGFLRKPLRHKDEGAIFIAGVLLIFCFPGFMAIAMQTVPASHGGVILGFLPLATAIISRIYTGEQPSPRFWVLSVIGCIVVALYTFLKADESGTAGISIGDLWLILAGLSASAGYVLFGKLSRETQGWEIVSRSLVLNIPFISFGVWWYYEPIFLTPSVAGLSALIYLGCFSMFLAFCAWNVALAWGGIARIGQMQLLQTFVTLIVSALLLGEHIDLITITTAALVTTIIAATRKS